MSNFAIKLISSCALMSMLVVVSSSGALVKQNLYFTDLETDVSFWGRDNYRPDKESLQRTEQAITKLSADAARNPSYANLSASASAWLAYWAETPEEQKRYTQSSVNAQLNAIQSRPAHRHSWIKLLEYQSNINNKNDEMEAWTETRIASLQRYIETI